MPLLDDRWPLDLFRLDGGQGRLMVMWSQMGIHVVVVGVVTDLFVADMWLAVYLICVVHMFHHTVRITAVVVRLIIGTSPVISHFVFTTRIWWPTGRGLPMGSKRKIKQYR